MGEFEKRGGSITNGTGEARGCSTILSKMFRQLPATNSLASLKKKGQVHKRLAIGSAYVKKISRGLTVATPPCAKGSLFCDKCLTARSS
jgi:hypothetical protein